MAQESNGPSPPPDGFWNEYKQLSSAAENLVSNSFQVPAVAIAVVTALAVSGNVKATYWGFGIMTGVFLLSIWLGYYHSTLNTYGLQLVKLETAINNQGLPGELTYYTEHVGKPPLGSNAYASMLAILVVAAMLFSGWNIWTTTRSWGWGFVSSLICISAFAAPTIVCFANMGFTERSVRRKKAEFISK
jgi:hypothetical protein